jgi:uncharacterized protein YbjT (DUF2867 family)
MTPVLVTGGTGHLGRDLVRRLVQEKHRVRVLARSPGSETDVEWAIGDLATGEGLAAALRNVHTVINAATSSPIARRGAVRPVDFFRSPSTVDVDGTRRLLALSEKAGVRHFLHVSIVGLDDASLPYARVKLAGERLVRGSSLSWSVVRAMPFYYLLERMLAGLTWLPSDVSRTTNHDKDDPCYQTRRFLQIAFRRGRRRNEVIPSPDDGHRI